jgi:hypothetical protein
MARRELGVAIKHFAQALEYSSEKAQVLQILQERLPREIFRLLIEYLIIIAEVGNHLINSNIEYNSHFRHENMVGLIKWCLLKLEYIKYSANFYFYYRIV